MSQASELLGSGYAELQSVAGQTVTFNGVEYDIPLMNRMPLPGEPGQEVKISTKVGFVAEFPIASGIDKGDSFTDENGVQYMVQRAPNVGHAIRCEGEVIQ